MSPNTRWVLGLVASVLVALAGQTDQFPHPWDHVVSMAGVVGTAISGYMVQRPFPSPPQAPPPAG